MDEVVRELAGSVVVCGEYVWRCGSDGGRRVEARYVGEGEQQVWQYEPPTVVSGGVSVWQVFVEYVDDRGDYRVAVVCGDCGTRQVSVVCGDPGRHWSGLELKWEDGVLWRGSPGRWEAIAPVGKVCRVAEGGLRAGLVRFSAVEPVLVRVDTNEAGVCTLVSLLLRVEGTALRWEGSQVAAAGVDDRKETVCVMESLCGTGVVMYRRSDGAMRGLAVEPSCVRGVSAVRGVVAMTRPFEAWVDKIMLDTQWDA